MFQTVDAVDSYIWEQKSWILYIYFLIRKSTEPIFFFSEKFARERGLEAET